MSNAQKAKYLGINNATIYNWKRNKPNLYRIIMLGFKFQELIESSKNFYEDLKEQDDKIRDEIKRFQEKRKK